MGHDFRCDIRTVELELGVNNMEARNHPSLCREFRLVPLWPQCACFLMATSSGVTHHLTKLRSSQTCFLNITMSSPYSGGLYSHQIYTTFGTCWNRHLWQPDQNLMNVSSTLLNLKNEGSEARKGSDLVQAWCNWWSGRWVYIFVYIWEILPSDMSNFMNMAAVKWPNAAVLS